MVGGGEPEGGRIGEKREQSHLRRIVLGLVLLQEAFRKMQFALVGAHKGFLVKKGLVLAFPFSPGGLIGRLVPHPFVFYGVVVFFSIVGGIIPGSPEVSGEHIQALGHGRQLYFPVQVHPGPGGKGAGYQGAPGHRANGRVGESVVEHHPFLCQRTDMGRLYPGRIKKIHEVFGVVF